VVSEIIHSTEGASTHSLRVGALRYVILVSGAGQTIHTKGKALFRSYIDVPRSTREMYDLERLEERLDRIEGKLDTYLETTSTNKADINWLKGSVKFIVTGLISVISLVLNYIFGGKL
jgi:hypothetical protein